VFASQLAFNILPEPEVAARTESRIVDQLDLVLGKTVPKPAITALQAPVFHSHVLSISVDLLATPTVDELVAHLQRRPDFALDESATGLSPVATAGSDKIHIGRVRNTGAGRYAILAVADNIRIAASNAVQTAEHIMLAPALDV
jgi:aspartate-semialdehyde dehydrogenase